MGSKEEAGDGRPAGGGPRKEARRQWVQASLRSHVKGWKEKAGS